MAEFDQSNLKLYLKTLRKLGSKPIPFATQQTINDAAFHARKEMQDLMESKFVLRNTWTMKSVQVAKSKGQLDMKKQKASVGSTLDYMYTQEFGGTKTKKGKHGVAIPTSFSSGESPEAVPRKKVTRKTNRMQVIKLKNRRKKGNRRTMNYLAVKQAKEQGGSSKFVFLDLGRKKGIFRIKGGKKNSKIMMVHDLSKKKVDIPSTPTLAPATEKAIKKIPSLFDKNLRFQLNRVKKKFT